MDPITIAALISAVGGAAIQYKASSDAQKRMREETTRSLENQRLLQEQAERKALGQAAEFEAPKRQSEQDQLADQLTQELAAPVSESQAIRSQQQETQGNVSADYTTAKARSDVESMKGMEALARLLGKTSSAGRLRMNEGLRVANTAQGIDQLAGFSRGQAGADNIAINQAGQVDPAKMFIGSLLQTAGTAGLAAGGSSLSNSGAAAKYGTTAGSQQTAMLAASEAGMGTGSLWNSAGAFKNGVNSFMRGFQ